MVLRGKQKGLCSNVIGVGSILSMGFTSLKHWMESDNSSDLVSVLEESKDISKTLIEWFSRNTDWTYNTPPPVDLCLVLEDGIITKDQVPSHLLDLTRNHMETWIKGNFGFQRDYQRLIKQVL